MTEFTEKGEKTMTLIEIIKKLGLKDKKIDIIYKTCAPGWDNKTLQEYNGYCRYEDGYLTPLDNDYYDFTDEISKYELYDGSLIVWYRSQMWSVIGGKGKWIDIPFPGEE